MSAHKASAAHAIDHLGDAMAVAQEGASEAWQPPLSADGPALDLQRRLSATVAAGQPFPELPVHPADRVLRGFSRAMGYVSVAGVLALIGWLVF